MTPDLYEKTDLSAAKFTRIPCGGSNDDDGEGEACPEMAVVGDGVFALRDSKNHGAGTLLFNGAELAALRDGIGGLI
ncbi:DUF397 domain-containing protein [Streptosporangium sp. NBC_01469]|uniref:DUF397 domain-containing protein n=1 Tax=Streptosporangium sp. NBC_01469 TaxID=2903898 RepID=UPI002E2C5815|nr:DUF397 domain-containing protein [Streptosporangium sp. NBC_01469]